MHYRFLRHPSLSLLNERNVAHHRYLVFPLVLFLHSCVPLRWLLWQMTWPARTTPFSPGHPPPSFSWLVCRHLSRHHQGQVDKDGNRVVQDAGIDDDTAPIFRKKYEMITHDHTITFYTCSHNPPHQQTCISSKNTRITHSINQIIML